MFWSKVWHLQVWWGFQVKSKLKGPQTSQGERAPSKEDWKFCLLCLLGVCGLAWEHTRKKWLSLAEVSHEADRSTWLCRESPRPECKRARFSSQASRVKWKSQNNHQMVLGFQTLQPMFWDIVDPGVSSSVGMLCISPKILQTRTFWTELG